MLENQIACKTDFWNWNLPVSQRNNREKDNWRHHFYIISKLNLFSFFFAEKQVTEQNLWNKRFIATRSGAHTILDRDY